MPEDAVAAGPDAELPGWFGKIPAVGDFVGRRLAPQFRDPWDRWLLEGMAQGEQTIGVDWTELYMTFPIWRFLAPAGVFGAGAWSGILLPSVDRVGRRFPLTIAVPLAGLSRDGGITALDERLDAMTALTDEVLEGASLEQFESRLAALRTVVSAECGRAGLDRDALTVVADELLFAGLAGRLLWWTKNTEGVSPVTVTRLLPLTPLAFIELVRGE